eukprot:6079622-Amphidinium_carterae.1
MTRICEEGREEPRRAPLFALAMMASLELYVTSTRPKYKRALAWVRLVKCWGCLRSDDIMGVSPTQVVLTGQGLTLTLIRTKTSGPGKRHKILYAHVDSRCTLVHTDWLAVGARLWQAWASNRDHFLLHPTSDLESVTSRMATPDNVASYGRLILQELLVPVKTSVAWEEGPTPLLPPTTVGFWTEHSERHWLPSMSTQTDVPDAHRDIGGRWNLNKLQSREYVLTSATITRGMQYK